MSRVDRAHGGHGRLGVEGLPHGLLERAEDAVVVPEADLALGGVNVDVDVLEGHDDVDGGDGEAPLHEEAVVGLLQREGEHAVLRPAAVDEEADVVAVGAVQLGGADHPGGERRVGIFAGGAGDLQHLTGHFQAVDGGEGLAGVATAGRCERGRGAGVEAEADVGIGEGVAGDDGVDAGVLGGGGAQELFSRGHVLEEPADDDGGAAGGAQPLAGYDATAGKLEAGAGVLVRGAGHDADAGDGGDAGQGLASEAERGYRIEFARGLELAGGEALEGELELV